MTSHSPGLALDGSHVSAAVEALLDAGWRPVVIPEGGHLKSHRQILILRTNDREVCLRLHVYKVTTSSRGNARERRVQITSTYLSGKSKPIRGYADVVLGYDVTQKVFVGLDPRRLWEGGQSSNASSFIEHRGLGLAKDDEIRTLPRNTALFGLEYQAYIKPQMLHRYLLDAAQFHSGILPEVVHDDADEVVAPEPDDWGSVSHGDVLELVRETRQKPLEFPVDDLEAVERGESRRPKRKAISPEEFEKIQAFCDETGRLGEYHALLYERERLTLAGRPKFAEAVEWISQTSVSEGYDIKSFNVDGTERYIEVKATIGASRTFEMTANEWNVAEEQGEQYWIYRVNHARSNPTITPYQNPVDLYHEGLLEAIPSGWRVTIL